MLGLDIIAQDTMAFPWHQRTPVHGLRIVIPVGVALGIGAATGHEAAGAIAAGAAYTVGFAAFHEALASDLLSMFLLTLGIASGTLIGSLAAPWVWTTLLVVGIAAVNYGIASNLGPTAGWMAQQCAVYVIIATYFPNGLHFALGRSSMILLGGTIQMAVTAIFRIFAPAAIRRQPGPTLGQIRGRILVLWHELLHDVQLRGATLGYILRLAFTLLLSTWVYKHYGVRSGYWAPMTAVLVLRPQWTGTMSRGLARLLGTMVAAGFALFLAQFTPFPQPLVFVLIIVAAWASYALQAVNYAAFSCFLTLYIVFLFRFGGFSQSSAAHLRLFNTALGGALALLVDVLWLVFKPQRFLPQTREETPILPPDGI
ncbi:Fusaric acid resistance protein-like [Bryocella elongata]|uniref:Fusaric acid resistance protein-like n=1 Tax=Bryocella elongata TaxID=863522 RepID=A0A1H6A7Y4_9BACT|nr:FUSC family protein [Bryocella elongata]SEG43846.1 Fusaric acid resistance protein-like [Bryocella elongata]